VGKEEAFHSIRRARLRAVMARRRVFLLRTRKAMLSLVRARQFDNGIVVRKPPAIGRMNKRELTKRNR